MTDYFTILVAGTTVSAIASYIIKKHYQNENMKTLNRMLDFVEKYAEASKNELSINENKLETITRH